MKRLSAIKSVTTVLQVPAAYPPRNIADPLRPLRPAAAPCTGKHVKRVSIEPPVQPHQPAGCPPLTAAALERQVASYSLHYTHPAHSQTRPASACVPRTCLHPTHPRRFCSSHPTGLAFHSIIVISPQKDDGGVAERCAASGRRQASRSSLTPRSLS